ncbi:MAG TPA: DNA gyrase subunit A, partial [Planctomycetota bacterium]|nr:DNA gyrase subunit A [Planctomycetota bacterium]
MQDVPGPDFPTGGKICGRSGIRRAYTTGRGRLTLRAKCEVIEKKSGTVIHITEIPFQQYVKPLIIKVVEAIRDERVMGVKNDGVRDLGGREGMLIEICLRPDADPNIVLNQLYKHTPLESTFSIINIALVNGRPRTLNLRELMQCHIDHRIDVIRRRTRFLLRQAEQRAHILQGLIIAVDNIDEVIKIIRSAPDGDVARARLVERFELSIRQAKAILEMQLRRLTGLERDKLKAEMQEVLAMIADYRDILANKTRVITMIRTELTEMGTKYGSPRRTVIEGEAADMADLDLIREERMVVTISDQGYIKREPLTSYRVQSRGGVGVIGQKTKEGDFTKYLFVCTTHQTLLCITNDGKMYALPVYEIPQLGRAARGRALVNLLELKIDQKQTVVATLPIYDFKLPASVIMMSRHGYIKKTALEDYQNVRRSGIIAMGFNEGDELLDAKLVERGMDVVICTRLGQAIRIDEAVVRDMGRGARGLMGPKLREGDYVVSLCVGKPSQSIMTVCEKGLCKRTSIEEYRKVASARAGGVRNVLITDRNGPVVTALIVDEQDQVMVITSAGQTVRASISDVGLKGRATQGVALIRLREEDRVASVALIARDPEFEATESAVREAVKLSEAEAAAAALAGGAAGGVAPAEVAPPSAADLASLDDPEPAAPASGAKPVTPAVPAAPKPAAPGKLPASAKPGAKPVDGKEKPPVSTTDSARLPVIDIGGGAAPDDLDLDDLGDDLDDADDKGDDKKKK